MSDKNNLKQKTTSNGVKEKIKNLKGLRNSSNPSSVKDIHKQGFDRVFEFAMIVIVNPTAFSVRRGSSFLTYRKALDRVLKIIYIVSTMITTPAFAQG